VNGNALFTGFVRFGWWCCQGTEYNHADRDAALIRVLARYCKGIFLSLAALKESHSGL